MKKRSLLHFGIAVFIVLALAGCDNPTDSPKSTVINKAAISGITAPATGGTPVTAITPTDQYTGTVTWNGNPTAFAANTAYTATITLTAKDGYTLKGVAKDYFTVAGATATNAANSGVITAVFPATAAENKTPVADDYDIGNLNQTAGSVTAVTITPQTGKSAGTVTIYYEGTGGTIYAKNTSVPTAAGTYAVTFNVAAASGWNAASGFSAGTLTINGQNQTPTAADYNIGNLTQTAGSVTAVTITPKTGKSAGTVTIFYEGTGATTYAKSTTVPSAVGTYAVTFNVAVAVNWDAATGLSAGTLTITPVPVTFNSVTANGSTTQTTTQLTLNFDAAITGLTAADITLSGVSGVSKGTLSGSNPYTLPVSGFTSGGTLNVAVAKTGYAVSGSPKTVDIYYVTPVTFNSVTANGSTTQTTTQLTLNFDAAITGLTAADITLSGVSGVSKGTLSGSNPYTLSVNGFTSGGTLNVAIAKAGYAVSGSPKTVVIYYYNGGGSSANIEMVQIPGGSFQMGKELNTSSGYSDYTPVHTVTLTGFYMGKYPVTQAQYRAVMGSNPSSGYGVGGNYPVYYVNWYDAIVFCNKLSMAEGLTPAYSISGSTNPADWGSVPTGSNSTWNAVTIVSGSTGYRLPTEAQWEYAAKGGDGSPGNYTYAGSNTIGDVAWYEGNNSPYGSKEVGTKQPNGLGLYDMSGNVWEWCWDWYGSYTSGAQTDPTGAASGSYRVVRGGSWSYSASFAHSVHRNYDNPNSRYDYDDGGFRLVRP